jgi:hypothetical protein
VVESLSARNILQLSKPPILLNIEPDFISSVKETWITADDSGSKLDTVWIKFKDHSDSIVSVGIEVGALLGTPDGTPVGNGVGRCVRSIPSGRGEEVVGLEVRGISVGEVDGCPEG